jgi:biotin carboxylase
MRGRPCRLTESEVKIGQLYEALDDAKEVSLKIAKKSTTFYEKQLAGEVHSLAQVMADVLYLVSEHLTCHDCDDEEEGGEP